MNIGERIKNLRKSKGLSQVEFAEKLDLTQGFISKVEKNSAQFTIEHLILVGNIFDVDMNLLLKGKVTDVVAEPPCPYHHSPVAEKINQMLDDMDEEAQRDVLKYTEKTKLLADLMKERQEKKTG